MEGIIQTSEKARITALENNKVDKNAAGATALFNQLQESSSSSVASSDTVPITINGTARKISIGNLSSVVGGGGSSQQAALTNYVTTVTIADSELPKTISDSNITADMVLIEYENSNPNALTSDLTVTTGAGTIVISGSMASDTSTTLKLIFGVGYSIAPTLKVDVGTENAANILQANPRPGVKGILPVVHGGTGANNAADARKNLDICEKSDLAIINSGDTATTAIPINSFVYIKDHTSINDGLYTANAALESGDAINSIDFTAVSGGGLNAIQQSLADVYSTTAVKTPAKWLNGNHIYRRVYPIDTLPNNATIQIPHGITSQQSIIAYSGLCYRKTARNQTRPLPFGTGDSNGIRIDTGPDTIYVITKADWTTYAGYVILEYVDN